MPGPSILITKPMCVGLRDADSPAFAGLLSTGPLKGPVRDTGGQVFNLKAPPFLATGDGVTDDTLPLRAALAAAALAGGTVFVPAGQYALTGTVTVPSGVKVEGAGRPHWTVTGGGTAVLTGAWFVWGGATVAATPYTMFLLADCVDATFEHVGISGRLVAADGAWVTGVKVTGEDAPDSAVGSFNITFDDVLFAQLWVGLSVGQGGSHEQCDHVQVSVCQFANCWHKGVECNSGNSLDYSVIESGKFWGVPGTVHVDVMIGGFLAVRDTAFGTAPAGAGLPASVAVRLAGVCDTLEVTHCQSEGGGVFFQMAGANDATQVIFNGCDVNDRIILDGACRVVGSGNYLSNTIALNNASCSWASFGDRLIEQNGVGLVTGPGGVPAGRWMNQRLPYANATGEPLARGDVEWLTPAAGSAAARAVVTAGKAAVAWNPGAAHVISPYDCVRPTAPNGHVYLATVAGTSGGVEPAWPTGAGQTVTDGGVTWREAGPQARVLPFGPLGHSAGTGPPAGEYHDASEFVFNSAHAPGAPLGWACTAAGVPGTWVAAYLYDPARVGRQTFANGTLAPGGTVQMAGLAGFGFGMTSPGYVLYAPDAVTAWLQMDGTSCSVNVPFNAAAEIRVASSRVVGGRGAAVADADGTLAGATASLNALLSRLRAATGHGLIT